jgi:hypothetical protein
MAKRFDILIADCKGHYSMYDRQAANLPGGPQEEPFVLKDRL